MMKTVKLVAPAAVALALGACNGGAAVSNRSLESVHQPVVSQRSYALDLAVYNGDLPPSEQGKLAGWIDVMNVGYGDRVAIDSGSNYDAASARATVAEMVSRRGLLLAEGAPMTPGAIQPGTLRVVITRSSASVPTCPDWSTKYAVDYGSGTSSNYGCATNSNIAAMVADPQDLVKGQAGALSDPTTASKAIGVYRDAKPTGADGLKENNTTKGGGG